MSIEIRCRQAEDQKLLQRYPSSGRAKRRLFLSEKAVQDLGSSGHIAVLGLRSAVRARFEEWVDGGHIISEGGMKPGFLKQLDFPPPEVWEFRISAPSAKVRAIGRFMCPDAYVVTGLYTRNHLGAFGSEAWLQAENQCLSTWKTIFGNFEPFSADSYEGYVTEHCDEFRLGKFLSERERELRGRKGKKQRSSRR